MIREMQKKGCSVCDPVELDLAGASDTGKVRERNEDHYLIADLQRMLTIRGSNVEHAEHQQLFGHSVGHLFVVADGMGGHSAGDVASSTAVESCARYVLDMMHWFLKLSLEKEEHFLDELSDCLRSIQRRLWSDSRNLDDRMGTTVTMAYVLWPRMYIVHAGDSRCYVLRNGTLRQLTTDHTFAQRLVEDGALSAEDAELSRWRHVLWNCVGGGDELVQPEVSKVDLHENDAILLCTDGLTEMCDDDEILRVLEARGSCGECVEELVRRANAAGGKDNVTAVLARFPGYLT